MIRVRPFRAWRPAPHTAHLVGSRSFLTYTPGELREKLAGNPYSFLHIVHADHDRVGLTRAEHFDGVRHKFEEFTHEGILLREERPAFYLYEQSCAAFTSMGLIGAVSVADYVEGRIKVHEQTLTAREAIFTEYLEHTGINAEPVLLAIPGPPVLEKHLHGLSVKPVLYDFCTTDRIRHRFWKIDEPAEIDALADHFRALDALYIADGHHRSASSARLAKASGAKGEDPKAWCLAYLVPHNQLHIFNFDRAVSGLNGHSPASFLEALGRTGTLTVLPDGPERCAPAGHVQVRTQSGWYRLELPKPMGTDVTEALDASVLSAAVLGPILGVMDLRTDPRIRFIPGTDPLAALDKLVDTGKADVAFNLCAIPFASLAAVADNLGLMPPKTTWVEPKLRSGLTIYSLEDN
ncbi:MAG: DUF1015 domain-containing protein [Flavobacteriales bacterium]|nr:DUF1015 domain-containing protein [Flavobacteriales bacterium]